jgi:hypothetical protein
MKERKSYFFKFKSFLKKFPFIVKIKKIILLNFLNEFIVNNKKKLLIVNKKEQSY